MISEASSSRALSSSPNPSNGSPSFSRCSTPDAEMVQSYQALMAELLPPLPAGAIPINRALDEENDNFITLESGEKRAMTKAEKQNAKKKRRKERERDTKAEVVSAEREEREREERAKPVAFRLFSTETAKDISLLPPAEDYPISINPRHLPLSAEAVSSIRSIARQSVVDPSAFSTDPVNARSSHKRRERHFPVLHAKDCLPPIFLVKAQVDKDKQKHIARIHLYDPAPVLRPKRQRTKRGRKEA